MHELGITQSIVAIVAEHAQGRRVKLVVLEIGALAGVTTDAIAFCFDVVSADTALAGATLEIRQIEALARCRACGAEFPQTTLFTPGGCGSHAFERLSGEELNIKEYEIDSASEPARDICSRDGALAAVPAQGDKHV
jgi:hydrogenase nickel incorporation protein HypA/HybF